MRYRAGVYSRRASPDHKHYSSLIYRFKTASNGRGYREGDKFENINQSVIATRGSFAHGIITLKEKHGDEVASAFKLLNPLSTAKPGRIDDRAEERCLDLLNEITQQGSKPDSSKSVLKSLEAVSGP